MRCTYTLCKIAGSNFPIQQLFGSSFWPSPVGTWIFLFLLSESDCQKHLEIGILEQRHFEKTLLFSTSVNLVIIRSSYLVKVKTIVLFLVVFPHAHYHCMSVFYSSSLLCYPQLYVCSYYCLLKPLSSLIPVDLV